MTRSAATPAGLPAPGARIARHVVCATLALALGLTCAVLAVAMSSGMSSMSSTNAMSTVDGMTGMTGMASVAWAPEARSVAGTAAGTPAVQAPQQMTPLCEDMCAGITGAAVCTTAGGFFLTGVAALLLASRGNTALGLLARPPRTRALCRRRQRTPWLAPSPVSLCVFRV